jgi:hypothetical protein
LRGCDQTNECFRTANSRQHGRRPQRHHRRARKTQAYVKSPIAHVVPTDVAWLAVYAWSQRLNATNACSFRPPTMPRKSATVTSTIIASAWLDMASRYDGASACRIPQEGGDETSRTDGTKRMYDTKGARRQVYKRRHGAAHSSKRTWHRVYILMNWQKLFSQV